MNNGRKSKGNVAVTLLFARDESMDEPEAGCSSIANGSFGQKELYAKQLIFLRQPGELKSVSRDLFVTLQSNSELSVNSMCRICHSSSGDLLTPCSCKGTMALVHLACLERWLKESNRTNCELCLETFELVRKPKYGIFRSIFMYLLDPAERFRETLLDLLGLTVYTPAALGSTYMLLMVCEELIKSKRIVEGSATSHSLILGTIVGMVIIDFTYATWVITCFRKHYENWSQWYNNNTILHVILPQVKQIPHQRQKECK